jgi:molecular chaperone HscA
LLSVSALEQISGVEARIAVKPSYGLGDDQITRMLQESFATADQDMLARAVTEAHVDADRMILATQSALLADADLLDALQRSEIDQLIQDVQASRSLTDAARIEAIIQALAKGTEAFAAQRMNRGIQKALSGKNIASI